MLRLLAFVPLLGTPVFVPAQLPPPNVLLTEPRAALLSSGPFDLHTRASTAFIYDDNISLHDREDLGPGIGTRLRDVPTGGDFIYSFSPGLIVTKPATLGGSSRSVFSAEYSPSFIFFMKNDEENSIDHSARLDVGYAFTKLTLSLVQNFEATAGGVVDVGTRVDRNYYATAAELRYEMTEKTFFQLDGNYRVTDYETLTDSEEWSATPTVNYQISPKVIVGLGLTAGQLFVGQQTLNVLTNLTQTNRFVTVETEPQTYLGPTVRASYKTTEKTDVSLSVGGEWRQYSDDSDSFSPVFSLVGSYRPFEGTAITLEGHRRQQNSAVLNGQNYIATGGSIGVRQRLREMLFATFTSSYD
ncbi:MAG TPA: hypothetical protein VK846_04845, partial [Candidatus Limnocylindria bacterium]|nr:hypothetical protein [Candidatus Limnocylindria bacterium]